MSGGSWLSIQISGQDEEADCRFLLCGGAALASWWALGWVAGEGLAFPSLPTDGVFSGDFLRRGSLQCPLGEWPGVIAAEQRMGAEVPGMRVEISTGPVPQPAPLCA